MMEPLEYTEDADGIIHLITQDPRTAGKTLCGIPLTNDFLIGDETLSGDAATCDNCRVVKHEVLG